MLESKRVVARLDLARTHERPRRAAAAIVGAGARTPGPAAAVPAVVALVAVWHATSGIRSPAAAIFVLGATVATIAAAPTIVTAVAVAAAAAAPPLPSALHATPAIVRAEASGPWRLDKQIELAAI